MKLAEALRENSTLEKLVLDGDRSFRPSVNAMSSSPYVRLYSRWEGLTAVYRERSRFR